MELGLALPDLKLTPDERKVIETAINFLEKKINEREEEVVRREKEESRKQKEEERALDEAEKRYESYRVNEVPGRLDHKEASKSEDVWKHAKENFEKVWGRGPDGCSNCVKSLKEKGIKEADSLCLWLQSFGGN